MKNKKNIIFALIIVIIIACLSIYFKPIKLSKTISENNTIMLLVTELGVKNGEPYIDTKDYKNITDKQKNNIIELFNNYSYTRTFTTHFSDGSISDNGDKIIYIYLYDSDKLIDYICISSSGNISVNDKTYKIKDATEFINKIQQACES